MRSCGKSCPSRHKRALDMGKEYGVRITPYALEQMSGIKRYIALKLRAPDTAEKWQAGMRREIASLALMPTRIALTEEEPWHSRGIHKMVVGNFLVYFWIDEETLEVWVTAVVYGRRDQREQLDQMEL